MVCCKVRRVSTSAGSVFLIEFPVDSLIRLVLVFCSFCISITLPRAPIAPRARSTWFLALFRLAMDEASVSSRKRCATGLPWVGESSAERSWLMVSSTFWVWWVLTAISN
ncbi:hypothetical protein D3C76_1478590 [compost metagenome]